MRNDIVAKDLLCDFSKKPGQIHDMADKEVIICSANHFVDEETCSKTHIDGIMWDLAPNYYPSYSRF